jgi:hypothetical protein
MQLVSELDFYVSWEAAEIFSSSSCDLIFMFLGSLECLLTCWDLDLIIPIPRDWLHV